LRALGEWPDPAPASRLLEAARRLGSSRQQVLALRGYVRLAGMAEDATAMYAQAFTLAQRPEDKKQVLAGLAVADQPAALDLVLAQLADETVRTEAGLAAVQIAARLQADHRDAVVRAMRAVVESVPDETLRDQAVDVLESVDERSGHILVWSVAGPFRLAGKDGRALFDETLPPGRDDFPAASWKPLEKGVGSWDINLSAALGDSDDTAACLRSRVWSPRTQPARMELGSDDAVKVWLNGALVHANFLSRSMSPRQDRVMVTLEEGWNTLQAKVVNVGGGWAFCCRLRAPTGGALPGLKYQQSGSASGR